MNDMILQYGALGLLTLVLLLGGKVGASLLSRLVDRMIGAFDGIVTELRALRADMSSNLAQQAALRQHVTEEIGDTRHAIRNALQTTSEQVQVHVSAEAERVVLRLRPHVRGSVGSGISTDNMRAVRRASSPEIVQDSDRPAKR